MNEVHVPNIDPAAPAQPDPAPTAPVLTATEQAVVDNDYRAFENAERASKSGKAASALPLAEKVADPAKVASAQPTEEQRTVSKRQQDANDRIRDAVSKATADLAAENARLKAQLAPPAAPRSVAPPVEKFPEYAAYLEKNPDATLEAWLDARDDWRDTQRAQRAQLEAADRQTQTEQHNKVKTYSDRMLAAVTDDPQLLDKISPQLLALEPREKVLAEKRRPGPDNDLATAILESENPDKVFLHLSENPDDLKKLLACETRGQLLKVFGRIEERVEKSSAPLPPPTKTVPDVPNPPRTLGSRPAAQADPSRAAVASNDYVAFERAEREKLAGSRVAHR